MTESSQNQNYYVSCVLATVAPNPHMCEGNQISTNILALPNSQLVKLRLGTSNYVLTE